MVRHPLIALEPKTPEAADAPAAEILGEVRDRLGFVPNMYGMMANLPAVLSGYVADYNAFRETSGFTPTEQETVFLAISYANDCHYCLAAHSMLADKVSGVPADALAALRSGQDLPDPKLNALAQFTRAMVLKRG